MKRNTITALAVAGVLGATGGVALAVQQRDPQQEPPGAAANPSASSPASTTTSPSPSPSAKADDKGGMQPASSVTARPTQASNVSGSADSTNDPLLWADKSAIHDGDDIRRLTRLDGEVEKIVRARGGYVVAERTSTQEPAFRLWFVPNSGDSPERQFADVVGQWDANATGTRVAALDKNGTVRSFNPVDGTASDWPQQIDSTPYIGWMGTNVLVSMAGPDVTTMYAWDPVSGQTVDPLTGEAIESAGGYPYMSVSPGGSYLTGSVESDGSASANGQCLHLESTPLKKARVDWLTCDWRAHGGLAQFSPDGTMILAVPVQTDGLGPSSVAVIDASDGPRNLVADFKLPPLTSDVQWSDNRHVFVLQWDESKAAPYIISRCDFTGDCVQLLALKQRPTLASTP